MVRIAFLLLCLSCGGVDGYRKKSNLEGYRKKSNRSAQQAAPLTNRADTKEALIDRSNYTMPYELWRYHAYGESFVQEASEDSASSLDEAVSRKGGDTRRRAPRRRTIPGNPAGYADFGRRKCLTHGRDPSHTFFHGQGHQCYQLCNSRSDCYGYSVSIYNNCLIFEECDLTGGGDEWGQGHCHVKLNAPCPTPAQSAPATAACPPAEQTMYTKDEQCRDATTFKLIDDVCCAGNALLERANQSMSFEKWRERAYGESFIEVEAAEALDKAASMKNDDRRRQSPAPVPQLGRFQDIGPSKCAVNGRDAKHVYHHFVHGRETCRNICANDPQCYGYSLSKYNNCLIWHECDLTATGAQWGNAHCHINLDRDCPTPAPTAQPTIEPTAHPTAAPTTAEPTAAPTEAPTKCPVHAGRDDKTGACVNSDWETIDEECCA